MVRLPSALAPGRTAPYSASFPTAVFTIAARVKLSSPGRRAAILARGEDNSSLNMSWQLYVLADGTLEIMLEDANENNMCYPSNSCTPVGTCDAPNPFVADGTWHHVAARRDSGGNLALFVDGTRRASCQGTGVPSSNNRQVLSWVAPSGPSDHRPRHGLLIPTGAPLQTVATPKTAGPTNAETALMRECCCNLTLTRAPSTDPLNEQLSAALYELQRRSTVAGL